MGYAQKEKMNVIVTGNAGFVGRNLTERLIERGYCVCGFDRVKPKNLATLKGENFKQIIVDIRSLASVERACKSVKDVKVIFHTVALQPTNTQMEILEYLHTNLIGAANLLTAFDKNGFKNIIVSSSFSVYGTPEYLPIDEKHPVNPNNVYGLTKLQAELLFKFYARNKDFNIIILRYDGIYGVGQTIRGFIEFLFESFSKDKNVELFNRGTQKRDNVYVGDVVEANLKAMSLLHEIGFGVFNIGGGEPKASLKTATTVKKILRSGAKIILSKKKNTAMNYDVFMNINKARKSLGYRPKGLRENIISMVKEARKYAEKI